VIYPDVTAGERDSLEQFLDFHRNGLRQARPSR
jgi:hypothetical protein